MRGFWLGDWLWRGPDSSPRVNPKAEEHAERTHDQAHHDYIEVIAPRKTPVGIWKGQGVAKFLTDKHVDAFQRDTGKKESEIPDDLMDASIHERRRDNRRQVPFDFAPAIAEKIRVIHDDPDWSEDGSSLDALFSVDGYSHRASAYAAARYKTMVTTVKTKLSQG
jgi:hypothetical protein